MTKPEYVEVDGEVGSVFTVGEKDFPIHLKHLRVITWPIQAVSSPANLYLQASLVVKADFGELEYFDNEFQNVDANVPFDVFAPDDLIVDVCPSFLIGGVSRQETPLFRSDNWGLAVDEIRRLRQFVDRSNNKNVLILNFEVKNLGQCQLPDLCMMIDALVYRPSLRGLDQPDRHSWRYSRLHSDEATIRVAGLATS